MKNENGKFIFNKKLLVFIIVIFVLMILVLCVILAIQGAQNSGGACIDGKGCKLGINLLL